ncbi:UV-stimulated scaffold protein A homolog isoform X1 [Coffea eugenioides]|uniref:UV-stimulated scaffold protein A homolog isoform X1 n=1 Tax=Coffea eugenioides TaxID=49369 RepID=UPI000F610BD6|nr:UV-stimulated scaffold protein A homolog isoform X1 [Coffea eugenioides]XP_027150651.1 UV-stimulated scaffold protein A homolog isoform X1 [Coffea eugenioides]
MEEEAREEGEGGREGKVVVVGLIEKATNSTRPEVDPRLLKAIKSAVRYSDSELRLAAQTLTSLMKRDHSQVRYLALLIIDELFMRSKLFRTLLVENLDQLLTLSVGFRRNLPLPAPAAVASVLRSKAIEFLEKWNTSFGIHYRQLRLGYDYLKNTLRYQFPNLQANAARIQQERREKEIRTKEILLKKFESLKENLPSIRDDIQSTVDEISECLDIIQNKDDNVPLVPVDEEEIEEFHNAELRQIRLDSLREGEKLQENSENKVIFDALRELYKVLVTKHLAAVQEWTSVLIRVEGADSRFRDNTLKELIDIRNHLQSVKRKCEVSGCALPKSTTSEEEDIWEEGTLESHANVESFIEEKKSELCVASTSSKFEGKASEGSKSKLVAAKKLDGGYSHMEPNPVRSKLMAEAPVLTWGSFLDNWGSNQDVLANQRGLEIENHWGRVDYDAVIPAEKIAELNLQAIVYKEEPVEIQPCRAPLKKGGLCPRKDLRVCPFHGPIIPRDDEGRPINLTSSPELGGGNSSGEEMSPDLVEKLVKQAVRNVRERDKEAAKKRHHDKQDLKRAKLAKVREHNEAVLRDAALASTSRSSYIGEDTEAVSGPRSLPRNKRDTLASMLKRKETTKDRLAQKLLSTRAKDATVKQLTVEEESNYKEAFPNQW